MGPSWKGGKGLERGLWGAGSDQFILLVWGEEIRQVLGLKP